MDEEHSIWTIGHQNYLEVLYYEYIYEHDYQLRIARNSSLSLDDTQRIVTPNNRIVEYSKYEKKSKFIDKLIQPARKEKVLIYERTALFREKGKMSGNFPEDLQHLRKNNSSQTMIIMASSNIDRRKRWKKLYNRTTSLKVTRQSLSAELSRKMIQLRYLLPVKEPAKRRYDVCHFREKGRFSKILIYLPCQMKLHDDDLCLPLIWNEPSSSDIIDEVSGQTLSHITLLCRDVICKCNKCTAGCSTFALLCYACILKHAMNEMEVQRMNLSGSYAEDCMLPPFYVQTNKNDAEEIMSDIDRMVDRGYTVGFDGKDCNIVATIETGNSPPGYLRLRYIGTGELISMSRIRSIGPPEADDIAIIRSRYFNSNHSFQHGPAETTVISCPHIVICSVDIVPYWSCPSWPPKATSWIIRKRYCNWPSKETIQLIVSKGCRIVHKPHELSKNTDIEFRFLFSEAELILFGTLTRDQKKCFIAFKALIKHITKKLENEFRYEIKLTSYCLKTIFFWTCETTPACNWQTANGWSRCLLYMIDQLISCLESGILPGYFISESNLLDTMNRSRPLLDEIKTLRCNPISYAAAFIDSTTCFKHVLCSVSEEINILCHRHKARRTMLLEQLTFLQNLVTKIRGIRSCLYWRKEAVLRIFANWCAENANDIGLAHWECLSDDMTLFDVVYLDIVHGFDVPNNVLMENVNKG